MPRQLQKPKAKLSKDFDPECLKLANAYLTDTAPLELRHALAQYIQQALIDFMADLVIRRAEEIANSRNQK